jgi:hypothetical protein
MGFYFVPILSLCAGLFTPAFGQEKTSAGMTKAAPKMTSLDERFASRGKLDGNDAEENNVAIGLTIVREPRAFLAALQKHKVANGGKLVRLDSLLGSLGDELTDKPAAGAVELRKRMDALRKVEEKSLRRLRDECIGVLEGLWKQVRADLPTTPRSN